VGPWDKIDRAYLEECPSIKYIGLCGTSTANIDLDELAKRGISFSNIISGDKESVAEFFFMQLVGLARGIGKYQWKAEEHQLRGKHIGIIGLGAVGQAIAHLALSYKMNTAYYSPHRKQEWEDKGLEYLEMNGLVKSSEIIMICSPTNVEVLSETEFKATKPGSILVQASAGSPFDTLAFMEWISHESNYALFDMSAGEKNYLQFNTLPRVIFSRAFAGDTYESNQRRGQRAVENLKSFLKTRSK
jgi:hypothetical protein